jgi:hypothetical protein
VVAAWMPTWSGVAVTNWCDQPPPHLHEQPLQLLVRAGRQPDTILSRLWNAPLINRLHYLQHRCSCCRRGRCCCISRGDILPLAALGATCCWGCWRIASCCRQPCSCAGNCGSTLVAWGRHHLQRQLPECLEASLGLPVAHTGLAGTRASHMCAPCDMLAIAHCTQWGVWQQAPCRTPGRMNTHMAPTATATWRAAVRCHLSLPHPASRMPHLQQHHLRVHGGGPRMRHSVGRKHPHQRLQLTRLHGSL